MKLHFAPPSRRGERRLKGGAKGREAGLKKTKENNEEEDNGGKETKVVHSGANPRNPCVHHRGNHPCVFSFCSRTDKAAAATGESTASGGRKLMRRFIFNT